MKLNGQDINDVLQPDNSFLESLDSFEIGEELTKKVLSERGKQVDSNMSYTIDTKRGMLVGNNGNESRYIAKADKTWRGFSEVGNFAEVRELYQERIKLGKSIFISVCIVTGLLFVLAILILIWLEVTYGT